MGTPDGRNRPYRFFKTGMSQSKPLWHKGIELQGNEKGNESSLTRRLVLLVPAQAPTGLGWHGGSEGKERCD